MCSPLKEIRMTTDFTPWPERWSVIISSGVTKPCSNVLSSLLPDLPNLG
ncbi:2%2C3-dihydroxybenzoate-AMP ligase [Vibrio cholerae]|nr:2%2C3-dihydroxybenzoate-AMP ligase [Vibrio cholerae]